MDTLNVSVSDITEPVADGGGDSEVEQYQIFKFDGSGSTDNVGVVNWSWSFTYGGSEVIRDGISFTFLFEEAGVFTVSIDVMDAAGNFGSSIVILTVVDKEVPTIIWKGPVSVTVEDRVRYDASNSIDNVGITEWIWTITHGTTIEELSGEIIEFEFQEKGEYEIVIMAADSEGNSASKTFTVTAEGGTPWTFIIVALVAVVLVMTLVVIKRSKGR